MPASLAAVTEIEQAWRSLSTEEKARAEYYLSFASRRVRDRWPDVDDRIAEQTLSAENVSDVVVQMVLGIVDGSPVRGARSWSETRGPLSQSVTLQPGRQQLIAFEDWMVKVFEPGGGAVPRGSFPRSGGFDRIFRHKEGRY